MNSNNLDTYGLSSETIQKIHKLFQGYPDIEEVLLYGSRAKGNYHSGSDIDLVITGEKIDYSQLLKIESDLDDLLLPYKIDISLFRQLENQELVDHIKRVGIVFYRNAFL